MWCARPNQFLGACSASTAQVYFLSAVPLSCLDVASACFVSYCIWNLVHTCRLSRRASCGELHITLVLKQSCSSFHRKKGKCSLCPGRALRWHTLSSYCIAGLPRLLLVGGPGGNLTLALSCGFPFLCLSRTYPASPTSLCSRRVCHPVAALCVCVCVSFIVYRLSSPGISWFRAVVGRAAGPRKATTAGGDKPCRTGRRIGGEFLEAITLLLGEVDSACAACGCWSSPCSGCWNTGLCAYSARGARIFSSDRRNPYLLPLGISAL